MVSPETEQGIKDESHLTLLAVFHFVLAGLSTLGLLFTAFNCLMMKSVFNNPHLWDQVRAQEAQQHQPMPPFDPKVFVHMFFWFYVALCIWSVVSLVVNIAAGIALLNRRARVFCLCVAAFNCVNIPFGTVLGIFAIIVLVRPSMRARFGSI